MPKWLMLAAAVLSQKRGSTMGLPIPIMTELLKFAEKVKAQRKPPAEKRSTDRVMTSEELIKHLLFPENDKN